MRQTPPMTRHHRAASSSLETPFCQVTTERPGHRAQSPPTSGACTQSRMVPSGSTTTGTCAITVSSSPSSRKPPTAPRPARRTSTPASARSPARTVPTDPAPKTV
jgi:hypothetical protein